MRRWHSETALMHRRWRDEMRKHGYDWRNPPDPACDGTVCHCVAGIGSMRKRRPLDCGRPRCGICHWSKYWEPRRRAAVKRAAIEYAMM